MMTIVVTGATSGIGLATATLLARTGSDVAIVGRTESSAAAAADAVRRLAREGVRVHAYAADLGRVVETERLAERVRTEHQHLAGLVLCAAVVDPPTSAADGIDTTLAVNHLSPVLLSQHLDASLGRGRIVLVSSSRHGSAGPFDPAVFETSNAGTRKYEMTKLLNLLYATARVARPHSAPLEVVDPGFVRTRLGRNARGLFRVLLTVTRPFQADPAVPASLIADRLRAPDFADGAYRGRRGPARCAPNVSAESADTAWAWTQQVLGRPGEPPAAA